MGKKIGVIGAGLAGLTAAYRLMQGGHDVHVFEAKGRVGGRLFSIDIEGKIGELGAQSILNGGTSDYVLRLIRDLDLHTESWEQESSRSYFDHGRIRSFKQLINEWGDQGNLKDRLEEAAETSSNMQEILEKIVPKECQLFQFVSSLLAGYEGAPLPQLSKIYVETLYYILKGGLSKAAPEEIMRNRGVKKGNDQIAKQIAEKLGARLHLKSPLKAVHYREGRYALQFATEEIAVVDYLILAIPCPVYKSIEFGPEVIHTDQLNRIHQISNGKNGKLLLALDSSKYVLGEAFFTPTLGIFPKDPGILSIYYTRDLICANQAELEQIYQKKCRGGSPNLSRKQLADAVPDSGRGKSNSV